MEKKDVARLEHEAGAGAVGAVAGALMGAVAGPPGIVIGAVLGAAAGAITDLVVEEDTAAEEAVDAALDREIGVTEGELGAPNLDHPPAVRGTYSAGSAGVVATTEDPAAEGPIQSPE